MDKETRDFACAWCSKLVCVCKEHDRGKRYCSDACREKGRAERHRQANRRYNRTERAREINRRRKRRARQKARANRGVTDHGGKATKCVARSPAIRPIKGPSGSNSTPGCHFCRQIPRLPAKWLHHESEAITSSIMRAARKLLARRGTGSHGLSDASDVAQEALAKLLATISEPIVFDRMSSLCRRFLKNVARNVLRKIDRQQAKTQALLDRARELALV